MIGAEKTLCDLVDFIRFDNGFILSEEESKRLMSAIQKEQEPLPSTEEAGLLVMGEDGVVPKELSKRYPNICSILSELLV